MRIVKPKFVLSSAVLATSALGFVLPAYAVSFKVSGQVDRAIIGANNGENSDVGFVDNTGSNSRFRFTGSQEMDNGMAVGFNYEIGLNTNRSNEWDINTTTDVHKAFIDTRKVEAYLTGAFGKISLGKGDGAANGTSEVDLSGTEYLGGGAPEYYFGGISFLDDNGTAVGTFGNSYSNFDALSRVNRIRYDTPSIGGFVFSASLDEGHAYETAARYETSFGDGGKFELGADFLDTENRNYTISPGGVRNPIGSRYQEYGGSASVLLPSGLNFTGMYKKHHSVGGNSASTNPKTYFGGIGYIVGQHHFQVGWGRTDDLLNEGSKGTNYVAAYVFDWTKSIQLYASYHLLKLDKAYDKSTKTSIDAQNINVVYLGTRIKFL